jgi:hypothetical protein
MATLIQQAGRRQSFQQYLPDVEPLVAEIAPSVGIDRAFLGHLCDLLPSGACSAQRLTEED